MSRFRPIAAACAVVVSLLAAACGSSPPAAAEVAGAEYSVEDLNDYLATTDPDSEARASRAEAAAWLTNWVFFAALELEMARRGIAVTNAHEAQAVAELTRDDPSFVPGAAGGGIVIRQRAAALAALEWTRREVPDVVAGEPLRHLCSRHILVETRAEADAVLARLGAGEDFSLLALDLSLDPGSGSLGGDLGCVLEGSFVAPFEDAAYAADPGEAVVAESQFGFHVIEVLSSGPATAEHHPQLDAESLARMAQDAELAALNAAQGEVQAQRQQLLIDLQEQIFETYGPDVRIDDRYGRWSPDEFRVVVDQAG
ncbi:MAG: peptidylprolyl isomerase [Acidimicrobiaceae bacterium]|nr:peptidylprolyl isomerase [Acidimicrobiaceae bacterium]